MTVIREGDGKKIGLSFVCNNVSGSQSETYTKERIV